MQNRVYSALILLVFMKNLHLESCPSKKLLMQLADRLGEEVFGIDCNFSFNSKSFTIDEMVKQRLLKKCKGDHFTPIALTDKTRKFIEEAFEKYSELGDIYEED